MDRIFALVAVAASLWLSVSCCWFKWLVAVSFSAAAVQFWLNDKTVREPLRADVSRKAYLVSAIIALLSLETYAYKTAFDDDSELEDEQRFGVALSVLLLSVWCTLLSRKRAQVALYALPIFAALTASVASGLLSGLSNPDNAEPRVSSPHFRS